MLILGEFLLTDTPKNMIFPYASQHPPYSNQQLSLKQQADAKISLPQRCGPSSVFLAPAACSVYLQLSPVFHLIGFGNCYKGTNGSQRCRAMETTSLCTLGTVNAASGMGLRVFFLSFVLDRDVESKSTIAATASRSNLFFARMYGAGQKPCFGLKPRNAFCA
jgi:hypothetical protein